jgi:MFS family permease
MDLKADARRIRNALFLTQSVFSGGYFAAVTVASIVGAALTNRPAWAGVPAAALLMGAAASATFWGWAMERIGRRAALTSGILTAVVGAALAGWAIALGSFAIYIIGMLAMGVGRAASDLGRYVAGEVHPPAFRARAISIVVVGGTVGAVGGPLLVGPSGVFLSALGGPELAGPYAAGVVLLGVAAAIVMFGVRPAPKMLAGEIERLYPPPISSSNAGEKRALRSLLRLPSTIVASTAMVFGQMIMVMVMVITSLHMRDHGHNLAAISLVISSHTFGMYAFSVISGQLADRWGRVPVILLGAVGLGAACLLSGISPQTGLLAVSLFLLGLGWNLCYVAGSALLTDGLRASERPTLQGFNDTLVGAASAVASLGSGVVFASFGYQAMGFVGAAASLVPLAVLFWWRLKRQRATPAFS